MYPNIFKKPKSAGHKAQARKGLFWPRAPLAEGYQHIALTNLRLSHDKVLSSSLYNSQQEAAARERPQHHGVLRRAGWGASVRCAGLGGALQGIAGWGVKLSHPFVKIAKEKSRSEELCSRTTCSSSYSVSYSTSETRAPPACPKSSWGGRQATCDRLTFAILQLDIKMPTIRH